MLRGHYAVDIAEKKKKIHSFCLWAQNKYCRDSERVRLSLNDNLLIKRTKCLVVGRPFFAFDHFI